MGTWWRMVTTGNRNHNDLKIFCFLDINQYTTKCRLIVVTHLIDVICFPPPANFWLARWLNHWSPTKRWDYCSNNKSVETYNISSRCYSLPQKTLRVDPVKFQHLQQSPYSYCFFLFSKVVMGKILWTNYVCFFASFNISSVWVEHMKIIVFFSSCSNLYCSQ